MNGRSPVGKKSGRDVRFQPQLVLNRRCAGSVLARIDKDVGADLRQGGLEQDEVVVVGGPARSLAKQLHRAVKSVQPIVQAGEGGVELEGLPVAGLRVRSQ